MALAPANYPGPSKALPKVNTVERKNSLCRFGRLALIASLAYFSPLVIAQSSPQVTGIDPSSGKVNDTVAVAGTNLEKSSVSAVFLSNDKDDFKAAIVEQGAEKIVVKVPQVKAGVYNVSIQVGDKLLIKPVRFTVE